MTKERNKSINECLTRLQSTRKIEYVEELYDLIAPTVRHIALKYLHDEELADDFVQDFWSDIYKIADGYVFHLNAFAYLCKVVKNRAASRYARLKNERAYVTYVDYSSVDLSRTECDSSQIDLIISVGQALKTLDETEKIIIQSTYFEGKTVRQIASELGLSKSSVARLKGEALDKLKAILCQSENGGKDGEQK